MVTATANRRYCLLMSFGCFGDGLASGWRGYTLRRLAVLFVFVISLIAATPAAAQTLPGFELTAEYSDAMVRHDFDREHYHGFAFEGEVYLRPQFAVVARTDAAYWSFTPPNSAIVQDTKRLYGVMGGAMVTGDRDRLAVPFARTLVGLTHASSSLANGGTAIRQAGNAVAIQFGAGVDLRATRTWSFRASLDARINGSQLAVFRRNPDWRFGAGVVFRPRVY